MKKVFALKEPGKVDARVVEAVKSDVRKYVKRERRKELPEGFTQWNFTCKTGPNPDAAEPCELGQLSPKIDEAVAAGAAEIYIEIVAEPGTRPLQTEA
jgi:hypothetical protein